MPQAYLVVIEGGLEANGVALSERDGAQLGGSASAPTALRLRAGDKGAHFLVVEMPLDR